MDEICVFSGENIEEAIKKATKGKVILKKGFHFLTKPVNIGSDVKSITICGEDGAKICGCIELKNPVWKDVGNGIYCTEIQKGLNPDALFLNGEPMILARYPNYREDLLPLGGAASVKEIKKRVKGYKNPSTGFIRAIHTAGWGGNSYFIEGKDDFSPTGLRLKWIGDNNRGSGYGDAMVIENVFEELDDEKEWYYASDNGCLYFKPTDEKDLQGEFHLGVLSELFKISDERNYYYE